MESGSLPAILYRPRNTEEIAMKAADVATLLRVLVLGSAAFGSSAQAGPFSDDLAKCLVTSTTVDDRATLVRWFFVAASLHPAVAPVSAVSEDQLDANNRIVADLFMRLLTDACRNEAREALKFEGPSTFETSFQVLGEVAGQEMFSHPLVNAGIMGMASLLDEEKLQEALEISE
jgi:hypothetical protein